MLFPHDDLQCFARVAPETLAQYQAHVRRLKDAVAQPSTSSDARDISNAESTDAADVVANVQAELVGQASSHSTGSISKVPRLPFQPAVPNSTRCICTEGVTNTITLIV